MTVNEALDSAEHNMSPSPEVAFVLADEVIRLKGECVKWQDAAECNIKDRNNMLAEVKRLRALLMEAINDLSVSEAEELRWKERIAFNVIADVADKQARKDVDDE